MKIVFVCHGNICRSPMAECVMKHLVREAGKTEFFDITSAAVSTEEIGNPIYPPAITTLKRHGIDYRDHAPAHRITKEEFQTADLVVLMDQSNLRWLNGMFPGASDIGANSEISVCGIHRKVALLMEFADGKNADVADPWYTGDFETTYSDVMKGCKGLLSTLSPILS
jgi:protein-tyrosine phosphatase